MRFALLERVPDNNQTASCITHPARGCSLLRDVRSDTCNNHVCESLTSIHAAKRRAKPVHAVVIWGASWITLRGTAARLENPFNAYALRRENGGQRCSGADLQLPAPAGGSQPAAAAIAANVS
jgi:hypothetical protein